MICLVSLCITGVIEQAIGMQNRRYVNCIPDAFNTEYAIGLIVYPSM